MVGYDDTNDALTLGDNDALQVGDYELKYNSTDDEWQAQYSLPIGGEAGYHGDIRAAQYTKDSAVGSTALDFSDDYVEVPRFGNNFDGSTGWAVSLWVYADSISGGDVTNDRMWEFQNGYHGPYVLYDEPNDSWSFRTFDGSTVYECFTTPETGRWIHYVFQATDAAGTGVLELYKDDTLVDSTTNWQISENNSLNIIGATANLRKEGMFDGRIDDFRVYSSPLTSTEINNLFNKQDVTTDLIAHYDFEYPETPNVAIDSTGDVYPKNSVPRSTSGSLVPQGLAELVSAGEALADDGNTYTSVQTAINNATSWVFVGPGTFNESVTISTAGMTLEGSGYDTHIVGGGSNAVNSNATDVTVMNLSASTTAGGGNPYSAFQANSNDVKYINCWARESDQHGFFLRESANGIVSGCTVTGSIDNDGIVADNASVADSAVRAIIKGNVIDTVSGTGITVSTDDCIVASNVINTPTVHGVVVSLGDNIVIGNRIISAGNDGIRLNTDAVDTIVANNRVSGSTNLDIDDAGTGTLLDANNTDAAN